MSSSTETNVSHHSNFHNQPSNSSSSSFNSFPILAIAVLGILTTAFLLVFYYVFVIKCCLNRRRLSFLRPFQSSLSRRRSDPFVVYAPQIENRGLDEYIIRSIPIVKFNKVGDKITHECAVCLNEFQEAENLRLLPSCRHAFHIDCIDIWLQSNPNCPLCRSIISPTTTFSGDQVMAQNTSDSHQVSISANGDVVIELSGVGSMNQSSRGLERGNHLVESGTGTAQQNPSPRKAEQRSLHKKSRRFNQVSSMGDECIDVRCKDERFSIQPIRRSFSMDFSADRSLYLSVQEFLLHQNQNLSGAESSSSSRVRRSFFSFGHGRGSRNAVSPIPI